MNKFEVIFFTEAREFLMLLNEKKVETRLFSILTKRKLKQTMSFLKN